MKSRSVKFARKAWENYVSLHIDDNEIPSLSAQNAVLKRAGYPVKSVAVKPTVSEAEVVKVPDGDDEDWVTEEAIDLDAVERVGVKRRLRNLQGQCRARGKRFLITLLNRLNRLRNCWLAPIRSLPLRKVPP